MSSAIQVLFCAGCCKSLQRRKSSAKILKTFTLVAVSSMFLVNFLGCTVQFVFSSRKAYQLVLYPIYLYFFVYTAVNYFMSAFTSPGYSTECKKQIDRICTICNCVKPFRTRHCSICDKCVTKWDHHCPWIQQCIGYNNYGYFFNMMMWSTVCLVYSFVTLTVSYFVNIFVDKMRQLLILIIPGVSICITAIFGFAVAKLFFFHVNLIRHNMTTVEYHETLAFYKYDPAYKHPYDKNDPKSNFAEVFPQTWRMFVPGLRIYPNFDPYYSYDFKFMKDLRCDFEFQEEPVHVVASALTYRDESRTPSEFDGIYSEAMILRQNRK